MSASRKQFTARTRGFAGAADAGCCPRNHVPIESRPPRASCARCRCFAGLTDEQHARLAAAARAVTLPAGGWLFRQGDVAETAYVVCSGRLDVVAEQPRPAVVATLKRGALLGELALLHEGARSTSVDAATAS